MHKPSQYKLPTNLGTAKTVEDLRQLLLSLPPQYDDYTWFGWEDESLILEKAGSTNTAYISPNRRT